VQTIDVAATCANLDRQYGDNPEFTGASCMVAGGNCDCIISAESAFAFGTSYTLAGTQLMFAGESSPTAYCVQGDRLQMSATMAAERVLLTLTR
jgi:hypothetical protein